MVPLVHLEGVAQRAGGAGDNGDLVHGSGVLLARRDQRVADLVVGDDLLFLLADDRALALVARDDDLHALLQIRLAHGAAAHAHGAQGGLVDDVGQLRAAGAAGGPADGVEINVRLHLHVLGVHLEVGDAALQVGKLDGDAPVESAGAQESLVQAFGAVGRGQDDHALGAVEAVHLGQQLVEGLLALVVAADAGRAVALFADGVDLVNKHDARGLIRGLLEQVAHLGRAHAHEHLHKFAAGDGEKRHLRLARDGLGQERLARARRAYEQRALGQGGADALVLVGVVEEVHDLPQGVLGLVLPGHVGKGLAGLALDVDFGVALAKLHGVSAHALGEHPAHDLPDGHEQQNREYPRRQEAEQRRILRGNRRGKLRARRVEAFGQALIRPAARLVNGGLAVCVGGPKEDLVLLHGHFLNLLVVDHGQKVVVPDLRHRCGQHRRKYQRVEQHQNHHGDQVVKNQRSFG